MRCRKTVTHTKMLQFRFAATQILFLYQKKICNAKIGTLLPKYTFFIWYEIYVAILFLHHWNFMSTIFILFLGNNA